MNNTGSRLKKYREYLKLSQDDVAKLLGSSSAYISLVENNRSKLSVENLVKLLLKYNINLNYLLAGIGQPFNTGEKQEIKQDFIKEIEKILMQYEVKKI